MKILKIPDLTKAKDILKAAESRNPGPWSDHSRYVAQAAQIIADQVEAMDGTTAYILGLMHDIGRQEGVSDMRHIIDGYRFFISQGYDDAARICLTHSFPLRDVRTMDNNWDGSPEDRQFIADYLDHCVYDDYDRLIQLCDSLSLPGGFCLIEKRLVEVALRRGVNELTIQKWQAFFDIQRSFEQRIGKSIYTLLPGVIENTFQSLNR